MHPETPSEIRIAERLGESMREELLRLVRPVGFDLRVVTDHGAVAFDVEYGPEISMLRPFRPRRLVISEPIYMGTNEERMEEEMKRRCWRALAAGRQLTVLRGYSSGILDQLLMQDHLPKFGICTRLNTWPEFSRLTDPVQVLTSFVSRAWSILAPRGAVVVSFVEDEFGGVLRQVADNLRQEKIGIQPHLFSSDTSLGRWVLVGLVAAQKSHAFRQTR